VRALNDDGCGLYPSAVEAAEAAWEGTLTVSNVNQLLHLEVQVHHDGLGSGKCVYHTADRAALIILKFAHQRPLHVDCR
jgi:hypothetical protein